MAPSLSQSFLLGMPPGTRRQRQCGDAHSPGGALAAKPRELVTPGESVAYSSLRAALPQEDPFSSKDNDLPPVSRGGPATSMCLRATSCGVSAAALCGSEELCPTCPETLLRSAHQGLAMGQVEGVPGGHSIRWQLLNRNRIVLTKLIHFLYFILFYFIFTYLFGHAGS